VKHRSNSKKRGLAVGAEVRDLRPCSKPLALLGDEEPTEAGIDPDQEYSDLFQPPSATETIEVALWRQHAAVAQYHQGNPEAVACCCQFINAYMALNGADRVILRYLDSLSATLTEFLQGQTPA
jgi:hypothetical protein